MPVCQSEKRFHLHGFAEQLCLAEDNKYKCLNKCAEVFALGKLLKKGPSKKHIRVSLDKRSGRLVGNDWKVKKIHE